MKRIGFMVLHHWMEQMLQKNLDWHRTLNHADAKGLEAYRAGFEQGWGECRNSLTLHGYLQVDENH